MIEPVTKHPLAKRRYFGYNSEPSDYGWLPIMGILTPKSLELIKEKREFVMKDGSLIKYVTLSEFSISSLKWTVENPGQQMFTGSFHPINDKLWEDRRNWDKRVAPTVPFTLKDIFEQRKFIKLTVIRNKAVQVLSSFSRYMGQDIVKSIVGYLSDSDMAVLCSVCKGNQEIVKQTEVKINSVASIQPDFELSTFIGKD